MKAHVLRVTETLLVAIITVSFLTTSNLSAQALIHSWEHKTQLSVEWYHPSFKYGDMYMNELTHLSGGMFVSYNHALKGWGQILFDMPLTYYQYEKKGNYFREHADFAIGNPFLGFSTASEQSRLNAFGGIRVPISTMNRFTPALIAENSDNYRLGSIARNRMDLVFNAQYLDHYMERLAYQVNVGAISMFSVKKNGGHDEFATYSGFLRYTQNDVIVGAGITGLMYLANNKLAIGDRTQHQWNAELGYTYQRWRPLLFISSHMDKGSKSYLNQVIGVRLTYFMPY